MEYQTKKCSSKKHEDSDAINYCQFCRVYLCEQCQKIHDELYNHPLTQLKSSLNDNISNFCSLDNHNNKLDFYCKTHNVLCCAACISKLKLKGNGQHSECDISLLDDIKVEKKNNLNDNIKTLEQKKNTLEPMLNEMKKIVGKINESKKAEKEKIKIEFIKLRDALDNREKTLLNEVDKKIADFFFDDDYIQKNENLAKTIEVSLEKGKLLSQNLEKENIITLIDNCLNVENNINND